MKLQQHLGGLLQCSAFYAFFDIALRHFMQTLIRFEVPLTIDLTVRRLG
jgi:hypothetical protein